MGRSFHFPSVRIASGNVRIINGPQDLETVVRDTGRAGLGSFGMGGAQGRAVRADEGAHADDVRALSRRQFGDVAL